MPVAGHRAVAGPGAMLPGAPAVRPSHGAAGELGLDPPSTDGGAPDGGGANVMVALHDGREVAILSQNKVAILSQNMIRGGSPVLAPHRMQVECSHAAGDRLSSEPGS